MVWLLDTVFYFFKIISQRYAPFSEFVPENSFTWEVTTYLVQNPRLVVLSLLIILEKRALGLKGPGAYTVVIPAVGPVPTHFCSSRAPKLTKPQDVFNVLEVFEPRSKEGHRRSW